LTESETLRRSILEVYEGLGTRTHFELLGVPRDATDSQVREAYFRLAKKFHPDSHHDPALQDLRDKLEEVFNRLGEAYEVLSNPRIRASYERDLAGRGGPGTGAEPGLTEAELAQESLRRASQGIARERYWEAIPLLETAIPRLEGKEKQKARILLARCYARHTNWVKQGEELLLSVIRQDPLCIEAHFYLGLIFYDQGLRSRALAAFKRVLELQPENEHAQAYVDALNPDGPPSSEAGLLKRLFRRS
jgi:tetratricopeptide (TPR) repeat protein